MNIQQFNPDETIIKFIDENNLIDKSLNIPNKIKQTIEESLNSFVLHETSVLANKVIINHSHEKLIRHLVEERLAGFNYKFIPKLARMIVSDFLKQVSHEKIKFKEGYLIFNHNKIEIHKSK